MGWVAGVGLSGAKETPGVSSYRSPPPPTRQSITDKALLSDGQLSSCVPSSLVEPERKSNPHTTRGKYAEGSSGVNSDGILRSKNRVTNWPFRDLPAIANHVSEHVLYLTRCRLRDFQRQRFPCPFSPWQGGEGGRQAG